MTSAAGISGHVDEIWEQSILPVLNDYIRIPNKSPMFDAAWQESGHMERALNLIAGWCRAQAVQGAAISIERLEGRTPVLLIDIPGMVDDTVLLYGHFDKQPEAGGWRDGLDAWTPVRDGDRLYGRGGADDGYSTFAALTAVRLLQEQGLAHARCVILIEGCEESGSYDLPYYLDALADRIGTPSLIVCLDSGCGNYDQLWVTTSLRGVVAGTLSVELLSQGVHSGQGSGVVASSFRVLRQLLDRVEDAETGQVLVDELHVQIPEEREAQASRLAAILGNSVIEEMPILPGVQTMSSDVKQLILNRTWRPTLSVTGADGMPPIANAGNVLRPLTAVKLSFRIPPMCDPRAGTARVKEVLEADPPYGARVHFEADQAASGWTAPPTQQWLESAIETASATHFGREAAYMGEGGTIPFMAMLGEKFPQAQYLITGLLGPEANPHGPDEFLHIPTAKKLTSCVADVLAAHAIAHSS